MLRIGIDTGGTFTDFVVLDGEQLTVFKLPSTPSEPEKAVLEGLGRLTEGRDGYALQHGSTVATNAFLERKGARCLLVTNQGFEDILEIGRQNRPELYRLSSSRPEPLVPERYRIGIKQRTLWDGTSGVPLESKSLDWLRTKVQQLKPEAIAVVLLYSYLDPTSELRIGKALTDFEVPISLSHEILPEFREFERTSTTVLNAYVQPIMTHYLSGLRGSEFVQKGSLTIMQSNGGSISSESAEREPVRTLFSGPAGGVVGAFEVARAAGYDKIITLDMGGTSTDVCLCDGRIETTNECVIDHHPVSIQTIGIHSVGAGGGSIAWIDEGGLLKVGPRSAGAEPGPICYGKGEEVTVTDANVFLGRLDPDFFLGGDIRLYPEKIGPALEGLAANLAQNTDHDWQQAEIAEGIIRIVNTQMERALRVISLQKGHDTREFTLVTFGGAGGLHACELARSLLIPRVLVPMHPGALSALGILRADVVQDASQTLLITSSDADLESRLEQGFADLAGKVVARLEEQGFRREDLELEESVDARYLGQSYELNVTYSPKVMEDFHRRHLQVYGYSNDGLTVEIVNLRVRGRARYSLPPLPEFPVEGPEPAVDALIQEKQVLDGAQSQQLKFYVRSKLCPGNRLQGPAVVLEYSATTWIPAGFTAEVDTRLNLIIEPQVAEA
ncbi:MAG: hydantoinase/oxoprolinase family protein [Acidobacteriota bacterium]